MSRGLDNNRSVTRVLIEQNPTIKRVAWAFGCAKKGSDAELELYNMLVDKLQEMRSKRGDG